MLSKLSEWNSGSGVDLETWVSCSGSFRLAVGYCEYFWPEFNLIDGYIVRAGAGCGSPREWEKAAAGDRRTAERTMNHLHLIDIDYHDSGNLSEDLLLRLGETLTEIYKAKLKWQFPDRPCTVSFHIPEDRSAFEDYQISFWQKSHEFPPVE